MIQIIPAIDIIDGKCVRLVQGSFDSKTCYSYSPLDAAKQFEDAGITRLHMVDLDGAKAGKMKNVSVLQLIASTTGLQIDFGGGIKTDEDVKEVFDAGASMINIGSIAAKRPELVLKWIFDYGPEKIFIGADVKNRTIVINGWQQNTRLNVINYINSLHDIGIRQIFCTDVNKDGMLQGPSIRLYQEIIDQCPSVALTASGGISSIADLDALDVIGCTAAIVGKALYEGNIAITDLKKYVN